MLTFNVKSKSRLCAFCRYWYDPTNSHIVPKLIKSGFWEYDEKAECFCEKTGNKMRANQSCHRYSCKI